MRRALSLIGAGTLLIALSVPTSAAPPERFEENFTILFPDEERGLVILINTTRDEYCTPEIVAYEEAIIEWIEGGEVGPFPDDPVNGFPEGNEPILTQIKETGQGALVAHQRASGLVAEIWPMIEDAPLVGPCTDTDPADTPLVGTAQYRGNDNDLEGSGTRGNAFGDRGTIMGKDAEGKPFKYSWRFHVNSRCFAPDGAEPACLIDTSSFR